MQENLTTTCPHRPDCDGCPLFELGPEAEAALKLERLGASMKAYVERYAWKTPAVLHAPSETLGWRNRARMVVGAGAQLGFYLAGSRTHLPIASCLVHAPFAERILAHVRGFGELGRVKFVDVRVDPQGTRGVLTLCVPKMDERWNARFQAHLEKAFDSNEVGLQVNVGVGDVILGGEQHVVSGAPSLEIEVSGFTFDVPPQAFFQANVTTLAAIHDAIRERELFSNVDVVLDAFCGVGVHGIALAPEGAKLVGYDTEAVAIEAARTNAERAGREATFLVGSDAKVELTAPEGTLGIVVNPARAGLSRRGVEELAGLKPEVVAYVSCSPTTFLRDAERLALSGYDLVELVPFDMMPRTEHIELLGIFRPVAAPKIIRKDAQKREQNVWIALLEGDVPRRGTLPGGKARIERLRKVGTDSVCRIWWEDDDEFALRKTCKAWGHPVLGDPKFGTSAVTHRAFREWGLDEPALHRLTEAGQIHLAPAHLVSIFRLPEGLLHEVK